MNSLKYPYVCISEQNYIKRVTKICFYYLKNMIGFINIFNNINKNKNNLQIEY